MFERLVDELYQRYKADREFFEKDDELMKRLDKLFYKTGKYLKKTSFNEVFYLIVLMAIYTGDESCPIYDNLGLSVEAYHQLGKLLLSIKEKEEE